jgi:4-amino-4-deoxy-L-arabinose transferase-like glycosyltransferase
MFAFMLAATWQRWTHPVIDHGREMFLPARILAGERLYEDIQYLYGPFAPYFNAALYWLFGVHLAVLHTAGAFCAVLILGLCYWLARQLLPAWEAALAAGLVLVVCALQVRGNYISPYSFAALYGLLFALGALAAAMRYMQSGHPGWGFWAGTCTGLAAIAKFEAALAALAGVAVALALRAMLARRLTWQAPAAFGTPVVLITAATFGLILRHVHWRVLLNDNYLLLANAPPQLIYFNKLVSGLLWPLAGLLISLSGLGVCGMLAGVMALLAALASWRAGPEWRTTAKRALLVLVLSAVWWALLMRRWGFVSPNYNPFSSSSLVLALLSTLLVWRIVRAHLAGAPVVLEECLLLVLAVFGFFASLRVIFNVTTVGPYVPFFLPVLIVVHLVLLFRYVPLFFALPERLRANIRLIATAWVSLAVLWLGGWSVHDFRVQHTFRLSTPRGSLLTAPHIGQPFAAALSYIQQHTRPEDFVLPLPQATGINFLAERRYPFREDIVLPGFITGAKERDAIERIKARQVPLILVISLDTSNFRDRSFGLDYNRELMDWIKQHYRPKACFDSGSSRAVGNDEECFLHAYEPQ